jgi:hypothetical protein
MSTITTLLTEAADALQQMVDELKKSHTVPGTGTLDDSDVVLKIKSEQNLVNRLREAALVVADAAREPDWVDAQRRVEIVRAVFEAIRADVPGLGPWVAFDTDSVQRMADALKPYTEPVPAQKPVAYLFTNVESGDSVADTDPSAYNDERELWFREPLGRIGKPATAQPTTTDRSGCSAGTDDECTNKACARACPALATPPAAPLQWVGLSTIDRMQCACDDVYQAINNAEATLREKNAAQPAPVPLTEAAHGITKGQP